jgi:hypothetical protein
MDADRMHLARLGSRDEGQWADPKVEPLWITATKQVRVSRDRSFHPFVYGNLEQEISRSLLASVSQ